MVFVIFEMNQLKKDSFGYFLNITVNQCYPSTYTFPSAGFKEKPSVQSLPLVKGFSPHRLEY